jgi:transcriptional regulator with XRE-family HTH domain
MYFRGDLIKTKAKEGKVSLQGLAKQVGVSRQTVYQWTLGQIPRGSHLFRLCTFLNLSPEAFFNEVIERPVTVPLHRTIKKKPVTREMKEASQKLAEQYLQLFRQESSAAVLPVIRMKERSKTNAALIANILREKSGIAEGRPMDYESAFSLLSKLGIYAIFREFPKELSASSYAFFSRIEKHRVVFINTETNVLDLIFQLLHETVHAIRDEELSQVDSDEEETFCDLVAEMTQFPRLYVEMVACHIKGHIKQPGILISRLKEKSKEYSHSLWGITYRLQHMGIIDRSINVGGAATKLNKQFPKMGDVVYMNQDPDAYIEMLNKLSPLFIKLVAAQLDSASIRMFGEWLGLTTSMDAKQIVKGLKRYQDDVSKAEVSVHSM